MDEYLKNLRADFAESESAEFQIVDDNLSLSFSEHRCNSSQDTLSLSFSEDTYTDSLSGSYSKYTYTDSLSGSYSEHRYNSALSEISEHREIGDRSRRSVRRYHSSNAVHFEKTICNHHRGSNTSDCFQEESNSLTLDEKTSIKHNRIRLTKRMERHRQNRWDPSPSSSSSRRSLSPGLLSHHRTRRSLSPGPLSRHRTRRSLSPGPLSHHRTPISDSSNNKASPDLPMVKPKRRSITATADRSDERINPGSLSPPFLDDCVNISHQMLIDKALAISSGDFSSAPNTRKTKTKTASRRSTNRQPSKFDPTCFPPSVPVRRLSIDEDPISDTMSRSRLMVPNFLQELPYQVRNRST